MRRHAQGGVEHRADVDRADLENALVSLSEGAEVADDALDAIRPAAGLGDECVIQPDLDQARVIHDHRRARVIPDRLLTWAGRYRKFRAALPRVLPHGFDLSG